MKRRFKLLKEISGIRFNIGYEMEIDTKFIEYPEIDKHGLPIFNKIIKYDPATRPDLWEEIKEEEKVDTYKLIKKYPGSPEIGSQCFFNGMSYLQPLEIGCKLIPRDEVENNPEYWEKVEKKEYWEKLWRKYNPRNSSSLIPREQLIAKYGESAWKIEQFMKLCLAEKISESLFRELVRYEFEECFNKLNK
jgi:hypothetical protein